MNRKNIVFPQTTIKSILSIILVLLLILQAGVLFVFSEGSKNLTDSYDAELNTYGYRPFTEWQSGSTAGILRHQTLYVYAKAGETIYFGDSVLNGKIIIIKPDNTLIQKIVASDGQGYIDTLLKEKNGPSYTVTNSLGVDVAYNNVFGYTPLSLEITETGVYTIQFHSSSDGNSNANPTMTLANQNNISNQGNSTVAMWDITVVNSENPDAPVIKTGRTFTHYLTLNTGNNIWNSNPTTKVLSSEIYMLTADGYIYETDFNGIDCYGLVFWGSNRGLIDDSTNSSLYASAKDKYWISNQTTANLLESLTTDGTMNGQSVSFHRPNNSNTRLDTTFKLFFEPPADDLPSYIKPTAKVPETARNFKFVGDSENHGFSGLGGYFEFDVDAGTSFQIKLDFSTYNATHSGVDYATTYLANSCSTGHNKIFWNGKDSDGNIIPPGIYGNNSTGGIDISISIASGEYHFPMLDVEANYYGIKLRLINTPIDADGNEVPLTERQRTMICYNNSKIMDDADGLDRYGNSYNQSSGIETSVTGASQYNGATAKKSGIALGDYTAIDIWTYYTGDKAVKLDDMVLSALPDEQGKYYGTINGFVYYDEENLGTYNIADEDYTIDNVTVELYSGNDVFIESTTTDVLGYYHFNAVEYDNVSGTVYKVKVVSPNSSYICTTDNELQTGTLQTGSVSVAPVGYHDYNEYYSANIFKNWTYSSTYDATIPASVSVTLTGKNQNGAVCYVKTTVLNDSNSWHKTYTDLPKVDFNTNTTITYTVKENSVTPEGVTITDQYNVSYESDLSYNGAYLNFYVTNTKKTGTIVLSKTVSGGGDANDEFPFTVYISATDDFSSSVPQTFLLKAGQTKSLPGVPIDAHYKIVETQLDGYMPTASDALVKTGVVKSTGNNTVNFVNHYYGRSTVDLIVSKSVTGNQGDVKKDFTFTLNVSNSFCVQQKYIVLNALKEQLNNTSSKAYEYYYNASFSFDSSSRELDCLGGNYGVPTTNAIKSAYPSLSDTLFSWCINRTHLGSSSSNKDVANDIYDFYFTYQDVSSCASGASIYVYRNTYQKGTTENSVLTFGTATVSVKNNMKYINIGTFVEDTTYSPITDVNYASEPGITAERFSAVYDSADTVKQGTNVVFYAGADFTFTLKDDESIIISGLTDGTTYTYTLTENGATDYITTINSVTSADKTITQTITPDGVTPTRDDFVNYKNGDTVHFSFTKVSASDTSLPLKGAEFRLYKTNELYDPVTHGDHIVTPDADCWSVYSESISSLSSGLVDFGELPSGIYTLVEEKAPTGYIRPPGQWQIVIDTASATPITITAKGDILPPAFIAETKTVEGDTVTVYKLPNRAKIAVPFSGSWSAIAITVSGAAIIIFSSVLFCDYYRKKKYIFAKRRIKQSK